MPRKPRGWKVWVEPSGKNWRCRWSGAYGTGQYTFTYKSEAVTLRDERIRNHRLNDAGQPAALKARRAITVGEGVIEYLVYSKKEKRFRTYRNFDKPAVESFRDFMGEEMLLAAVTPSDVQRWKHDLAETTTASMHFRGVCTFLNYMVLMKHLTISPAKGLKKPPEGPGGRAMADDEIVTLLEAAPEVLYRTGTFSLNTYLRLEEVTIFDWKWTWELPGGEIMGRIPWQMRKTRNTNKDQKDCVFPINAAAREVMGDRRPSGRVFPWSPTTIQHQMARTRAKTGLAADISFHSFRHTGATRYLANNGHMEDLLPSGSNIWKDPRSLLRYVHVDPKTLVPRFAAVVYPVVDPTWPLNRKTRRPHDEDGGS